MTVQKRSLKVEKLARIYDDEIGPVWGSRFGKMLLRGLAVPEKSSVLDISCGTGYPTVEILRRMTEGSRLIAIDASSAMLDVARKKVAELGPLGKKGVYFRTESPVPKLSFADDVYDLVVCNLGLGEMPDVEAALRDFSRVAKRGGEVRCTLALAGTFEEFHDIYREVLIKHDKHEALERLERYLARYPTLEACEEHMRASGLVGGLELEEFSLLFKSSREFFFAPVIEYGPLADWKEVAGGGQEMQDIFWYIKEAIDAYFEKRPFQVTVKAGCVIGRKFEQRAARPAPAPIEPERRAARPASSPFRAADDGDARAAGDDGRHDRRRPLGGGTDPGGSPMARALAALDLEVEQGGFDGGDSDEFDVLGEAPPGARRAAVDLGGDDATVDDDEAGGWRAEADGGEDGDASDGEPVEEALDGAEFADDEAPYAADDAHGEDAGLGADDEAADDAGYLLEGDGAAREGDEAVEDGEAAALDGDAYADDGDAHPGPSRRRARALAAGSVKVSDPDELEVEELSGHDLGDGAAGAPEADEGAADVELDAFVEGRARPSHLDD